MKIYTKTGDDGETALFGGKRVSKNSPLIEAIGEVDELNAQLGLCRAALAAGRADFAAQSNSLKIIQNRLFNLGAALAGAPSIFSTQTDQILKELEDHIDQLEIENTKLSGAPLKNFILPAGCKEAAHLHVARAVCRRAERAAIRASASPSTTKYLNRLSDMLFVMARNVNLKSGTKEEKWTKRAN